MTTTEFASLPDKYRNKRKPVCIGAINGVNCIPLRDDSTASDFDYLICDTSFGDIQSVSAVYFDGKKTVTAVGDLPGKLISSFIGENGFGYDPIFIPNASNKTLAQYTSAEKNMISHRAKAFNSLKNLIS